MLDRQQYERFRVSPTDPATIRVENVEETLARLAAASAGRLAVEKFAASFEGRPISVATLGNGPKRVLLWSQMHGDESTHTAVMLDLLSYLLRQPAKPFADELLAGCTLYIFPLLNPDGAERQSRFNAQDIDVNRDAARLATPEGRALRRAVDTFQPEFGFNLHNQNARTSVGNPPKVAIASLLAPPPDAKGTETDAVRRAKLVAATFTAAVRSDVEHVGGMISRYDDTYEPRAFGDTIQATGCATVLVEAGGWPEVDSEPMVRLHFHGMLTTLHAIATGNYVDADPQIYESLPESNSRPLVDCLIAGGHVLDEKDGDAYRADLGIDHSHGNRLTVTTKRDGRIVDVGDLSTSAGQIAIDASGCLVVPGRIALATDWGPTTQLSEDKLNHLLRRGITTVVGMVDLADHDAIEAIDQERELPVNWGFIVRLNFARSLSPMAVIEHVALAAAKGVLAAVGEHADESFWQHLDRWGVPLLQTNQLPSEDSFEGTYRELVVQNWKAHQLLNVPGKRGQVGRGSAADLQLFEIGGDVRAADRVEWRKLKRVVVAGEVVWENGRQLDARPGILLRRR